MQPGTMGSAAALLHGVVPSLLLPWKRRMSEASQDAVRADEEVVPLSRLSELGRPRNHKTMETESLREALETMRQKSTSCACHRRRGTLASEGRG
jgi:transposase